VKILNCRITPFAKGNKYSLELEDFEPTGGYEVFLRHVCPYLGEGFLDWHQGIAEGIGHITYRGYKLAVYWTDFPFALSFDCQDKAMAEELKRRLEAYFAQS
jgi:hypothetical protein